MHLEDRFVQVIQEHEGIIYKVARIYTHAPEDQNDLYQEIILQLWKAWKKFREDAKVSTWMYRIAMNTAITYMRKRKRSLQKVPIDSIKINFVESSNPELEERLSLLYRHIESLSTLDKGIILLYLEDRSYEEMAEITGLSTSNIGTRLSRIKQKLKSQMVKSKN